MNSNETKTDDFDSNDSSANDEQLVAYLDGELDADTMSGVETRLAADAGYRRRLHQLEKAWAMLDDLPREKVDDSFAQSTIEMVAVAANDDVRQVQLIGLRRQRQTLWAGVLLVALVACIGFAVTHLWVPTKNDRLIEDLPVVERLDQYQQIEDIEFLEWLVNSRLFPEEIDDEF